MIWIYSLVWLINACVGLRNGIMRLCLEWEIRKYKTLPIRLRGTWMKIKTHTWMEDRSVLYKKYTKNNVECVILYILFLLWLK